MPAAVQVVFRTDASLAIGTGHVMRCLTLAHALTAQGACCTFICRAHAGHLMARIQAQGFAVQELAMCAPPYAAEGAYPPHAGWLACSWAKDAEQTSAVLAKREADWLIVDHYALDARWEQAVAGFAQKILVIDDLADRAHAGDLLLDSSLNRVAADYTPWISREYIGLFGANYALLREEFRLWRIKSLERRARHPKIQRIQITMGGVDLPNATGAVLAALSACTLAAQVEIDVVMGDVAPHLAAVRAQAAKMLWPTRVHTNIANMAELMAMSDIAIGAAGSTSWERCCLGLPSILVILADNQIVGGFAFEQAGAARVIPHPDAIAKELPRLFADVEANLSAMSARAAALTDGLGAARVARAMGVLV
ncbi:MAG: UDP-2,4-diacetamido-2,4,6-trideoxy-beta-L-altropyranose hydrolase [Halothiobacillus sp. 24-54-40]|jgi:UDP-2,4-diacetamido-2,4,6-trideoxy-beta-L-altropyranose hydrolase|nr:MAG: UDP-2,4-diacetamido-2,4,6-trideoxy-beta-L-altropyranose hydrolase [Halothiobacillus sp. 35-54-62]OYZ86850.1 MAG: UDP-2,4-diacetamido-2,4,6-trideoxy-beta-L-altropyranose hydrolase [Halothiobacillus sp. 24-54-40]OZA81023.1 MAG: UDP-2,4-diacetamido-2,4,6-trideoxy-beta-L-altropyranose hydrolase [Halothiobacillus sp. 39-53-45]HQS02504.1 UDP-2,4-diacetamido-2,4,6-trideoxy-beta-L-altropyranose hydrolase [Halothiobacillus sp.]HQS29063.1 UDP-2,4-diacetamido-2,4,6-trideoxy-beta-L-altropyranose hy